MSGYISEIFGYRAEDTSDIALQNVSNKCALFYPRTAQRRLEIRQIEHFLVFVLYDK